MMLEEKVRQVEELFADLDSSIAVFQSWSGLHCKSGCGKCCFKPDIEATILEFLPFALHLNQTGVAEDWLSKLGSTPPSVCLVLNPTQSGAGLCSDYKYRGLICRLFGYSARTNKYGDKELVTCKVIKSEQTSGYETAVASIEGGKSVPVMNQFYMKLHAIDGELSREFFPINIAIRKAIEMVLHHYAYRQS